MKANFETGLKLCSACKQILPVSEYHKDKYRIDGLTSRCKTCAQLSSSHYHKLTYMDNREKIKERQRIYRETHRDQIHATNKRRNDITKEKRKDYNLKWKYGISLAEVRARLDELDWRCQGCGRTLTEETYVIDHDHYGDIGYRLILCLQCNSCIGFAKDNPETLRNLAHLVETYKQSRNTRDGDSVRRNGVI